MMNTTRLVTNSRLEARQGVLLDGPYTVHTVSNRYRAMTYEAPLIAGLDSLARRGRRPMITLERHKRNEEENKRGFVAIGCAALMALALILGTSALAKAGSTTAETASETSWISVNDTEATFEADSFLPDMTTETDVGYEPDARLDASLLDGEHLDGSIVDAHVTPPDPIVELAR